MLIRDAMQSDAADISNLMSQLGYKANADLISYKIETLTRSPDDAIFLAVNGNQVTGCLSAHTHELFHMPGRLGRITSLIVDSNARGLGVGRALIDRATTFFIQRNCVRIEVTSGDHRPDAHDFYRTVGFIEDERRFVKRLVG